jgi:hypothetical protein
MRKTPLTSILLLSLASVSHAHFIWGQFESDRTISLYLAEQAGEDVLPTMERISQKFQFLTPTLSQGVSDATYSRFSLGRQAPVALVKTEYGVVDRGQGVYKLTYFSKAVQRPSDAKSTIGKGFELSARLVGDTWEVSGYLNGQLQTSNFELFTAKGEPVALANGVAVVPVVPGSILQLRASRSTTGSGTFEGKRYASGREWTTLSVPDTCKISPQSEPIAFRLLQQAAEGRETLAVNEISLPFTATDGQDKLSGVATLKGKECTVSFSVAESSYTKHVRSQVTSLLTHRLGRPFAQGDGRYRITSGDTTELGTRLFVHDSLNSKYRVRDGRITEVVRDMNGETLTLRMTRFLSTRPGRYLSQEFTSTSEKGGVVRSSLVYKDEFQLIGDEWLPKRRQITGSSEGRSIKMEVRFEKPAPQS